MKMWSTEERDEWAKFTFKFVIMGLSMAFIVRIVLIFMRVDTKIVSIYWRLVIPFIFIGFVIYNAKKGFFKKYF